VVISPSARRRLALGGSLVLAWRPTGARLIGLLRSMITSFIALGVAFYVLPGRQSSGPLAVFVLVITVAVVGTLLRPLLLGLAVLLGSFGLLLVGLLSQATILAIAVSLAPDVHVSRFTTIVGASWIAATVAALVNWLLDAGTQDAYHAQVLGRVVRIAHRHRLDGSAATGRPGLLVVQLDGVGRGLLRQAVVAGAVPTLSRWLRTGTHRGHRWHTGLPATTPAGQAAMLHGDARSIPSFRWFDKGRQRLFVANRPADAHVIERELSTGRGLLADGGVSVSNLFSGDAPTRILTMSDAHLPARSTRGLASFAATSLGFVRTIVVFAGQVVAEAYQARRQRRRDVRPRVARGRTFALLRGVTTALLHDLNVAIVAEQMARGAPVIFVDFVDYDEIAHHAGPSRPEAMRTLDALDRVLRFFGEVADESNRRYEIVVLSDHGQAQGEPFARLTGCRLEQVVAELCRSDRGAAHPTSEEDPVEQWGPANVLLTGVARSSAHGIARLARRRAEPPTGEDGEPTVSLGRSPQAIAQEPVVAAAGSLAHIYLPGVAGRADRTDIDRMHPALIRGLAAHPGIGLVMVRSGSGPIAVGPDGWRRLDDSADNDGDGTDPVEPYGPHAAADLLDLDAHDHCGDLVVLGRFDPDTGEVAAFEELVGSHGGLGGDQTEAFLLVPKDWPALPTDRAMTGREVHDALLARLRTLGLRPGDAPRREDEPAERPVDVPS
jgi:uncharacterized membrane protein YvlD (DUF360 family)